MNQLEAESIATRELEPCEKLIWAGAMKEGRNSKIWMTLIFLPLCACIFFLKKFSHGDIFFTVVFLVWLFMLALRIKAVQAISNQRLIVIKPGKSIYWFSINDVKSVETRPVNGLIFKFSKLIVPTTRALSGKGRGSFDDVPAIDFIINCIEEPESIKQIVLSSIQPNQLQSAEALPTYSISKLKIKAAMIGVLWWSCLMGLAIGVVISLYQILVEDTPTILKIFSL